MILTKSEYLSSIQTLLPDNSTQLISPLDLRTSLINLVDSVTNFIDGDINADNFSTPEILTTRAIQSAAVNYSNAAVAVIMVSEFLELRSLGFALFAKPRVATLVACTKT